MALVAKTSSEHIKISKTVQISSGVSNVVNEPSSTFFFASFSALEIIKLYIKKQTTKQVH